MVEIKVDEILWTDEAKLSFDKIIAYLKANWSEKEIKQFLNRTNDVLATLKRYPEMFRASTKRKNVHIAILNKHTKMVYHYKPGKKRIVLLQFWGMKQNPARFKF